MSGFGIGSTPKHGIPRSHGLSGVSAAESSASGAQRHNQRAGPHAPVRFAQQGLEAGLPSIGGDRMGMKEAMLGEVADRPLRRTALVRQLRSRHPLARWKGLDTMVDTLRREGLLSAVILPATPDAEDDQTPFDPALHDDEAHDPREDPTPVGLSPSGRARLREWLAREAPPGTFRDDLLLQIAASEVEDLPALETIVRERTATVADLAPRGDDEPAHLPVKPDDWHRRRLLVARELDRSILDGLARGLRRAHAQIFEALAQQPPHDR
jgi:hypothetical protein